MQIQRVNSFNYSTKQNTAPLQNTKAQPSFQRKYGGVHCSSKVIDLLPEAMRKALQNGAEELKREAGSFLTSHRINISKDGTPILESKKLFNITFIDPITGDRPIVTRGQGTERDYLNEILYVMGLNNRVFKA